MLYLGHMTHDHGTSERNVATKDIAERTPRSPKHSIRCTWAACPQNLRKKSRHKEHCRGQPQKPKAQYTLHLGHMTPEPLREMSKNIAESSPRIQKRGTSGWPKAAGRPCRRVVYGACRRARKKNRRWKVRMGWQPVWSACRRPRIHPIESHRMVKK